MKNNDLTPTRPYLLRAMHEWMTDNGETPLILVDANDADVEVPVQHVEDGHIVLNISWSATHSLQMDNDAVSFEARFSGVAHSVYVPMGAVQGVYARESGQGMMFQDEPVAANSAGGKAEVRPVPADSTADEASDSKDTKRPNGRPDLRIIK